MLRSVILDILALNDDGPGFLAPVLNADGEIFLIPSALWDDFVTEVEVSRPGC